MKYNHLVANLLVFHNIVTLSRAFDRLQADGRCASWSGVVGFTVSSKTEDSPGSTVPARPLRSMHTGQNFIAPESSLPQLGQVRWVSVLIALTALQPQPEPKAIPRSTPVVRNRPVQRLAFCCPVPQTNALYYRVKPRFGTKFRALASLQRPVLIMSFGDEVVRN